MKLNDILTFVKAGYTFDQVKELMAFESETETPKKVETLTETEIPKEVETPTEIETPKEDVNVNAEIETLKQQLADSNKALKDLQHNARQKDLSLNQPKAVDVLGDIARSFM